MHEFVNRREFLITAALIGVSGAPGCGRLRLFSKPHAARIIPGQIPERIPGSLKTNWPDEAMLQRAASMHPFDIQGRMELAASAMTCCVDPDLGYIGYSQIHFNTRPTPMQHVVGDF